MTLLTMVQDFGTMLRLYFQESNQNPQIEYDYPLLAQHALLIYKVQHGHMDLLIHHTFSLVFVV